MQLIFALSTAFFALLGGAALASLAARIVQNGKERRLAQEARGILEQAKSEAEQLYRQQVKTGADQADRLRRRELEDLQEAEESLKEEDGLLNTRTSQLDKLANLLNRRESSLKETERGIVDREKGLREEKKGLEVHQEKIVEALVDKAELDREATLGTMVEDRVERASLASQRRAIDFEAEMQENADRTGRKWMSESICRVDFQFVKDTPSGFFQIEKPKQSEILEKSKFCEIFAEKSGVPTEFDANSNRVVFNINHPFKKEMAKRAVKQIAQSDLFDRIADSPEKLDPVMEKTERTILKFMNDETRRVIKTLGFKPGDFSSEMQHYMGLLKFRFSFLQNIVDHSLEVAFFSAMLGEQLGLDIKMCKRAGYLHDIGKSIDYEVEGTHPQLGKELAQKLGEPEAVFLAAGHHHDDEPESQYAAIAKAADALSAGRPGARKDKGDFFNERISGLERICKLPRSVDQVAILNAGRDVRVIVDAEAMNDEQSIELGQQLADQIEEELTYPGQIQLTVIRENRASAVAR